VTAEVLKLCIYILTPSKKPGHWNVNFYTYPEYKLKAPDCTDNFENLHEGAIEEQAFVCDRPCGKFEPVFLLLDVGGEHYMPMESLKPKSSVPHVTSKAVDAHSLQYPRLKSDRPQSPKLSTPRTDTSKKLQTTHFSPQSPKPMSKKDLPLESSTKGISPPKKVSHQTDIIRRYLELIQLQMDLVHRFMKAHGIQDQELLNQYSHLIEKWEEAATRLFS
jgi:hypothetical protein